MDYRKLFVVERGKKLRLADRDPAFKGDHESQETAATELEHYRKHLAHQQSVMYAEKSINIEAILDDLYASEINVVISWLWDGGIDVKLGGIKVQLGDELNGYKAKGKVRTMREAAVWLRDEACRHYPDSGFARKYGGFV